MSTPLQTIQDLYGAFGAGDVDRFLGMLTEDIDWRFVGSIGQPYLGQHQGKAGVLRFLGLVAEFDEIQAFEPREFFAGPDHVTVLGWERTRIKPNGEVFETPWVHVFQLRGDKVARFVGHYDTAAAWGAGAGRQLQLMS